MRDSRGRFIKGQPSPRKGVFGVVTSSRKGVPQLDRRGEHAGDKEKDSAGYKDNVGRSASGVYRRGGSKKAKIKSQHRNKSREA